MRILIVYPKIYIYGGAEQVIVKLCNYLFRKGIENTLLTSSIIPEVRKDIRGTKIIVQKDSKDTTNIVECAFFLWRKVKDNLDDFDLINVHNFPAEISSFLSPKPVVWLCNEPEMYLRKSITATVKGKLFFNGLMPFEKYVVRRYVDSVIVADEYNAQRFKRIYGITPRIVNYGVDYGYFSHKDDIKTKHEMGYEKKFVILHVGVVQHFKNQLASLKMVKELKDKIPNLFLILAGHWAKGYKTKLDEYIKENSLENYVLFTGHIDRAYLKNLYYVCDVLVHPIKPQGGWLSPFEALCAGKPVVVSPDMTASDILSKENIGIVSDQYADVVMDIYKNPEGYSKKAQKGATWIKENLTWDKFCENMVNEFDKVYARFNINISTS
jgi:glycosyltransferase involved in cell wall biosynthesis